MLGIFGDSSADPNKKFSHSWVELLERDIEFDNYARQGSSLLYTYDQLLKHGNEYDKIVIFVAPVGRLWMPSLKVKQHFVNHATVDLVYSNASSFEKKILNSIKAYFTHVWNFDTELLIQRSIIDSIRINFPTALLIPVTKDSVYDHTGITMHDISLIDYQYYNVHEFTPDFGRTCHMNKKNNEIFYLKIKKWLQINNFCVTIENFTNPVETKEELFYNEKY